MTDKSFTDWFSMSDQALASHIGNFVKHRRLEQNKTQDSLAYQAGVSRSTLSLLERGETVTLATLIQVLRALDQLQIMEVFSIQKTISPIMMAKMERKVKNRARSSKKSQTPINNQENNW